MLLLVVNLQEIAWSLDEAICEMCALQKHLLTMLLLILALRGHRLGYRLGQLVGLINDRGSPSKSSIVRSLALVKSCLRLFPNNHSRVVQKNLLVQPRFFWEFLKSIKTIGFFGFYLFLYFYTLKSAFITTLYSIQKMLQLIKTLIKLATASPSKNNVLHFIVY